MPYLLDSNILIYHLGGISDAVSLVSRLAPEGIAISTIVFMEVYQSTLRSHDTAQAQRRLAEFLTTVPILPFTASTAIVCAELRERLVQSDRRIRPRALDLTIAATALEHDLTLVTRNRQDFQDIPDLQTLFFAG